MDMMHLITPLTRRVFREASTCNLVAEDAQTGNVDDRRGRGIETICFMDHMNFRSCAAASLTRSCARLYDDLLVSTCAAFLENFHVRIDRYQLRDALLDCCEGVDDENSAMCWLSYCQSQRDGSGCLLHSCGRTSCFTG
jgi:hypothetical protein